MRQEGVAIITFTFVFGGVTRIPIISLYSNVWGYVTVADTFKSTRPYMIVPQLKTLRSHRFTTLDTYIEFANSVRLRFTIYGRLDVLTPG